MAIKWKNNKKKEIKDVKELQVAETTIDTTKAKKKTWIGYLLAGILILITSIFSYKLGFSLEEMQKNSEKKWEEEYSQSEESGINLDHCSDKEKMAMTANIYYLNYNIENMYEGTSAAEYLLKDSKAYKKLKTTEEKQAYEKKAQELMNIIYSCYRFDYSVGAYGTNTYIYDTKKGVSAGVAELESAISGKNLEELEEKYKAYIVIEYGEDGKASIKNTSYNVEGENFSNYVNSIKLQAIANYFVKQDGFGIYEIEPSTSGENISEVTYGEEIYEGEIYDEEIYEETLDEEEIYAQMDDDDVEVSVAVSPEESDLENANDIKIDFPKLKNKKIVIGFTLYDGSEATYSYHSRSNDIYELSYIIVGIICLVLFAFAIILQNIKYFGLKDQFIFNIPTELVLFASFFGIGMTMGCDIPYELLVLTRADLDTWILQLVEGSVAQNFIIKLPQISCVILWICFYGAAYWIAANLLPYILHPMKNIKDKSIIVKIIRWLGKQWKKLWNYITAIEVEKGVRNNVLKIVIANMVLVTLFCCIWVFGIFGVILYSIVLYLLLIRKGTEIQKQYQGLLELTKNMAKGDLNEDTSEDLGIFEPLKAELSTIRKGFKQAVDEEVRSQNMKTELITNVSHDLKTPLTAIITYVDLLKDESLTEETRKEYIATLDKKSQRLKVLIEDLFEVSKASTNNITMHYADVDLVNLIKQVRLENEERIMDSDLNFRWNLPEEKCVLRLDPQKTYRIIENLIINALKYSMGGSRVYVDLVQEEKEIIITIKNISATELNFDPEEITERFVRGDLSRNTEGSGLGLAIVRSFTELQNGKFYIEIDGDLFKATVVFYK